MPTPRPPAGDGPADCSVRSVGRVVQGPVLVGGVARTADLRTAFAVVAAAAVLTAVLARPVTQWAARAR